MIAVLLNFLTIFFIAAGFLLLCLNVRAWRKRKLHITPIKDDESPDEFDS